MAKLTWTSSRLYESGLDRGVLYLPDGRAIAWNGLISVSHAEVADSIGYYIDGIKHLNVPSEGDFSGTLNAYTYPDEFEDIGVFALSYRTVIGTANKIHILYNLVALPSPVDYGSIADKPNPSTFSWDISGRSEIVPGYRPTAHVVVDTTGLDPTYLTALETFLYGSNTKDPQLPSLRDLMLFFTQRNLITITDNGDGTWTATTANDDLFVFLPDGSFQISGATTTTIDANTYTIATT